jgi:hypothetical protein
MQTLNSAQKTTLNFHLLVDVGEGVAESLKKVELMLRLNQNGMVLNFE